MTLSVIRVGNSKAVIIPAKVLHKLNIQEGTELTCDVEDGAIKLSKAPVALEELHFPKVQLKEHNDDIEKIQANRISFTKEEIENDERLAYILSR